MVRKYLCTFHQPGTRTQEGTGLDDCAVIDTNEVSCVHVMGVDVASLRECDDVRCYMFIQKTSELGWDGVSELRASLFLRSVPANG